MAEEEKGRLKDREDRRKDPPQEQTNSRFALAAEADRSRPDERGPPPVQQNSRFAAAAEADRSFRDDRGPPPVATNSRFAAAAMEAERESQDFKRRDDRGPPPIQNSRFAQAASEDYSGDRERNDDRRGGWNNDDRRGGRGDDRGDDRRGGGDRFDDRRGGDRFGGGRGGDFRGGGRDYDDPRNQERGGYDRNSDGPREEERKVDESRKRVEDLLKPKAPLPVDNILKPPTIAPQHEANILKVPTKPLAKEHEDNIFKPPTPKQAAAEAPKQKAKEAIKDAEPDQSTDLLDEFVSGGKLGADLKKWCQEQKSRLPKVEALVYHLLNEKEKLNPDPACKWAEPSNYGAALMYLVGDNIGKQMQVLFAIQKYCEKLGFPKVDNEYVVQAMFRAMYKYDLAEADAFLEWKEDDSDENSSGRLKAVVQTVEWFQWLDQDDEEDDDGDEEEDE